MEPVIPGVNRSRPGRKVGPALPLLVSVLFLSAGCGTLRQEPDQSILTREERRFADALAHYAQGLIHQKELDENAPEAFESFKRAAELDPDNYALHSAVGMLARHQEEPDVKTALAHYTKAIELAPTRSLLYIALAELHFHQKQDEAALEVLRTGLEKARSRTLILAGAYRYVRMFIADRSVERAVKCLEFLANHSEQPRRYHHLLGHLYIGLDNREQAIHHYTMAAEAEKPLAESFIALAGLYAEDQPAEAIATLIRGSERVPDNPHILFALAQFYSAEDKFDEAIAIFAKIKNLIQDVQQQTLTAEVYLQYGATCERARRHEEAEKIFEECIELHPDAHRVLNYLAYMWAEEGVNLDKAHAYVTRALALKSGDGAYLDTLGWIYYKQKRYRLALKMIQKAAEAIPDDPVICDHMGDVYRELGEHEDAIKYWSQSYRLDSTSKTVEAKLSKHGVNLEKLRKEGEELKKAAEAKRKKEEEAESVLHGEPPPAEEPPAATVPPPADTNAPPFLQPPTDNP